MDKPLSYYDNNFCGTVTLLKVMAKHNCKNVSARPRLKRAYKTKTN